MLETKDVCGNTLHDQNDITNEIYAYFPNLFSNCDRNAKNLKGLYNFIVGHTSKLTLHVADYCIIWRLFAPNPS